MGSTLKVELRLCPSTGFEPVSYSTHHFRMASRGGDASTSAIGKDKKNVQIGEDVGRADVGKSIEQLNEPDGVIVFSKKQFNVRLRFPLSLLFKQFLHFTKIPHAFLHPNIVRILMGCSMLNMLYHLDISLLEVLFIYTIKMSKKEIFSLSADISSLQLVIGLLDSTKGAKKGYVVVSGPCDGPYEHPDHPFELRRSLGIPAPGGSSPTTSSTTRPPSKKFVPRPTEKALDLSPPFVSSFPSTSIEVGIDQGSSNSPSVPPSDTVQPCLELVVRPLSESTCPVEDKVPTATPGGKAKEKDAPAIPSSWEEIAMLLKAIPCFTAPEPPTSRVEEFFMFSHCHFVNLSGIPCMAGMARPSHVAQDSALRCTYPLLNILLRRRRKW
ncbi:hypothetical protein CK203_062631 [Vitis vinifera]|uniref:Uncharacterized protein n=1 Tax=Vitis vinifera TaxID=29760 RepID=A0A438GBM5_VITVI|nr:hypothetical protein CK203_062631 [Vitis vinifera]